MHTRTVLNVWLQCGLTSSGTDELMNTTVPPPSCEKDDAKLGVRVLNMTLCNVETYGLSSG